jgi:hypothetical protein
LFDVKVNLKLIQPSLAVKRKLTAIRTEEAWP